jgi:hypothetical protein
MEDVRADGSFLALRADVGRISGRTARNVSTILREPGFEFKLGFLGVEMAG